MLVFLVPEPKKHRDGRCQGLLFCQLTKLYETELPIPPPRCDGQRSELQTAGLKSLKVTICFLKLAYWTEAKDSTTRKIFYIISISEMLAWNVSSDLYVGLSSKVRETTISSTSRVNDVPRTGKVRVSERCCDLLCQLLTLGAASHFVYVSAGCGPHLLY